MVSLATAPTRWTSRTSCAVWSRRNFFKFDGTPLFPERRAYTVNYKLSDLEAALYAAVTAYVREEWKKVDDLADGKRRGTVGFALTPCSTVSPPAPRPSTSHSNAAISDSSDG